MRLSAKECSALYRKYNNPNIRRFTDEEYKQLAKKYPKIAKHIELAERRKNA